MNRRILWAIAVPVAWAALGGRASAQFGYVGPGSTAEGDIARGYGVLARGYGALYDGLGRYNVNSAIGRSIDTDTMIRWNQYVYESIKEANRLSALQRYADRQRALRNYADIRKRIRDYPNASDLMHGDALNLLLEDMLDPKIGPSALRSVRIPLRGGSVQRIPFQYAQLGGVISLRQLTVEDGWPLPLRAAAFDAERKAYLRAVDTVLEQDLKKKLTPEAVKAVSQAVAALRAKVNATIPETDQTFYVQAQAFLKQLDQSARMLQVPLVEDVLAELETYPGTTVADLLEFMQRFNLRFSPADTPSERELYHTLYPLLAKQRDGLGLRRPDDADKAPGDKGDPQP
jgi:hypothetical protein